MNLSLPDDVTRWMEERIRSGEYASAEDIVLAGLRTLQGAGEADDFAPGEWEQLLAEGERQIEAEGTLDSESVFREIRDQLGSED